MVPADLLAYNSDPLKKNSFNKGRPDINRRSLKKVDEVIPMANSNVGQIDPHSTKNGEHSRQRPAKPGPFP